MTKEDIKSDLKALIEDKSVSGIEAFLNTLDYRSERTARDVSPEPASFLDAFPPEKRSPKKEDAFQAIAKQVHMVFQITDYEISKQAPQAKNFDAGDYSSFVFLYVELRERAYRRREYAEATRLLNRCFRMPAVVLFRKEDTLTLAFPHRRVHKRDPGREVLGLISLVQEIDLHNPHRAHLEILHELSLREQLGWMSEHSKPRSFDGLMDAWLSKLNTDKLTKDFYKDLFAWFERAVAQVQFPSPADKSIPTEEHVIRLITRILFIWFIKEKALVSEALFRERDVKKLLKDKDLENGDTYYRAILQNLFFATLNTEMDKRNFSRANNPDHRNFSLYRYKDLLADEAAFLKEMKQTPFINGGLFDCLDSFKETGKDGYRVDCFTDHEPHRKKLSVPDRLFFGKGGLLPLLEHYKFTVEESTPIEQEVALDPELLGKVFESLLAAYNPETKQTARKQTGSYYTPREVVDYMVNEALFAYLKEQVPAYGDEDKLRDLLNYETEPPNIEYDTKKALVRAIAHIRVLDPAVGSGAFPMGILQKLAHVLDKIDPDNTLWKAEQKALALEKSKRAYDTEDRGIRNEDLTDISDTFERFSDDFGRKLYLIQNSIFGVDIQPVATQIAKLRFFISLAIEQRKDVSKKNLGIQPLPNLETRFVAADTLLDIAERGQQVLATPEVLALQDKLHRVRERFFSARTRQTKKRCKDEDEALRRQLAEALERAGFGHERAERIADWNPYDQNAHADWFDPAYMFSVQEGFHIVIGNPPYVRQERIPKKAELLERYSKGATGMSDLYVYFYLRGLELCKNEGTHIFICSNTWLDVRYGDALQEYLLKHTSDMCIAHSEAQKEFGADVNSIISTLRKGEPLADAKVRFITFKGPIGKDANKPRMRSYHALDMEGRGKHGKEYQNGIWGGKYLRAPDIYFHLMEKCKDKLVCLGDIVEVQRGITTGANEFFFLDEADIAEWGIEAEFLRPAMKTPREHTSILVDPKQLPHKIFICPKSKAELQGTRALQYIEGGEKQDYHLRPTYKNRPRWWALKEQSNISLMVGRLIRRVMYCFVSRDDVFCSHNFQEVHSEAAQQWQIAVGINSILSQLFANILCVNYGGGGGVMEMSTYNLTNLPVLRPELLSASACEAALSRAGLLELGAPDRHTIDRLAFAALGLTQAEQTALYEATHSLVRKRLEKAKSTKKDS